jgi:hypothetical protein
MEKKGRASEILDNWERGKRYGVILKFDIMTLFE